MSIAVFLRYPINRWFLLICFPFGIRWITGFIWSDCFRFRTHFNVRSRAGWCGYNSHPSFVKAGSNHEVIRFVGSLLHAILVCCPESNRHVWFEDVGWRVQSDQFTKFSSASIGSLVLYSGSQYNHTLKIIIFIWWGHPLRVSRKSGGMSGEVALNFILPLPWRMPIGLETSDLVVNHPETAKWNHVLPVLVTELIRSGPCRFCFWSKYRSADRWPSNKHPSCLSAGILPTESEWR